MGGHQSFQYISSSFSEFQQATIDAVFKHLCAKEGKLDKKKQPSIKRVKTFKHFVFAYQQFDEKLFRWMLKMKSDYLL